jgi:hypothetical protein
LEPCGKKSISFFQKNKLKIMNFFETNIDKMLRRDEIPEDEQERRREKSILKAGEKELAYEMNPYTWKLQETEDDKMKAVPLMDKNENKDWSKEENELMKHLPDEIVAERQKIIDKLRIKEEFPEIFWKYCIFTKEEYLEKQRNERDANKRTYKSEGKVMPREIIIPKLIFDGQEMNRWHDKRGAIFAEEIPGLQDNDLKKKLQFYISGPRYAFMENGIGLDLEQARKFYKFFHRGME